MIKNLTIIGYLFFFLQTERVHSKLIISEFVTNNNGSLLDEDDDPSDWIELLNTSEKPISLEGYYLTDEEDNLKKWKLPNEVIPANDYFLVFASGKDRINEISSSHANFSLSSSGEYLALTFDGLPVSEFSPKYPNQYKDISYGYNFEEKIEGYFSEITPKNPNATVLYTGKVADTKFSNDRGFYQNPFSVTITSKTNGATIIYTTDGSKPTLENGIKVTPIDSNQETQAVVRINKTTPLRAAAFKEGLMPSNIDTQTYLFLENVLDQPKRPEGYPFPWIARNGQSIEGDYEMDPNVVGKLYSRDELKESLLSLPTISIVTNKDNLFDSKSGIQVNPKDSGPDSEREISLEFLNFENSPNSQENAGLRMNGNASRLVSRPKHNLRVIFRGDYGEGTLNYPLFGKNAETERFNSFILRGGNGNSWIHPHRSVYENAMYIRDQWFRDAHELMGYPEALQREVHVYFNGLYWGMHHLFERIEEEWSAERFGGNKEDWEGFRVVAGNRIEIINGTDEETRKGIHDSWLAVLNAASQGNMEQVKEYLDLNSFIDYIILNFQAGNNDWDQNNVRAMRRTNPPGKFMFFCHDSERAGLNVGAASVTIDVTNKNNPRAPTSIHNALTKNKEYKILFADRVRLHLFNDGALTPKISEDLWRKRADGIRSALKAESARWGDLRKEPPLNLSDWERSLKREYEQWFSKRHPIAINQFRSRGLYPSIEAPDYSQHGGEVPPNYSLTIDNPNNEGTIFYTLDGSDPRTPAIETNDIILIEEKTSAKVLIQSEDNELGLSWTDINFDDSSWGTGQTGIGFERIAGDFESIINYPILEMRGKNSSCLIRLPFEIPDKETLTQIASLKLYMKYDDGFAAFINGKFVAGKNNPDPLLWNSRATKSHPDQLAAEYESIDITSMVPELLTGRNMLAIQGMNTSRSGSDFLISPMLTYGTKTSVGISESAFAYSAPINLSSSGKIKSRILNDGEWSAINEANFIVGSPAKSGNLVVSELLYNPIGNSEEDEFIELMNISNESIELSGVQFSSGISYKFKDNDRLGPLQRLVLTPSDYDGQLDNGGERITLIDSKGDIIESFRYNDKAPWFKSPDGNGPSLVRIAPTKKTDPEEASNWRPSVSHNGNPGSTDASPFEGEDLLSYAIQSATEQTIRYKITKDINDNTTSLVCSISRNLGADDVKVSVEFSTNLKDWNEGEFLSDSIDPSKKNELSWKSQPLSVDSANKQFARLRVSTR